AGARAFNPGQADLTDQVKAFLARPGGGGVAPSDALYVVWIGGNDIRTAGHSGNTATANTLVTNAVNAIAADVQTLINKGAHTVVVPNAGDVGTISEFTEQSPAPQPKLATQAATLCSLSRGQRSAATLVLHPSAKLDQFVFSDFSGNVAANAASLGITDTTDPCLKSNFTPNANCIDPVTHQIEFDKFLFWD